MNYKQNFSEKISGYLNQLKQELDEDLPRIGERIPDVTLGEADSYIERVSGLVGTYESLFRHEQKQKNGNGGVSYYQRHKQLKAYDEKIEAALPGILEKEGYVTAALVQQYAGVEESEASKRLALLSRKYKWKVKQDPQKPEVVRYSPARASKSSTEAGS